VDLTGIDMDRIPRHVAAVMDGNGRWATQRGLKRTEGHGAGEAALFDTLDGAIELGLDWFTVYAFSTENWRRPTDEVRYLMGFNKGILDRHAEDLHARNVRIQFIGRRDWRVPRGVAGRIDWATDLTRNNTGLTFTIAFNYGGRAEIIDAVKQLVADGVPADKVNEKAIRARLYDPSMPDPELMVRTSGEYRISNYLLWQLAYSELIFTDTLWPDFRKQDLADAIREFQARDRRFGGVKA
jgi:undecaprenyl diphosphate synthase